MSQLFRNDLSRMYYVFRENLARFSQAIFSPSVRQNNDRSSGVNNGNAHLKSNIRLVDERVQSAGACASTRERSPVNKASAMTKMPGSIGVNERNSSAFRGGSWRACKKVESHTKPSRARAAVPKP